MKKWIIFCFAAAGAAACTSGGHQPGTFTLTGKINGLDTGTIYLSYGGWVGKAVRDSTVIVHGEFKFQDDSLREPALAYLYEKGGMRMDDPNSTGLYIEPAAMNFEADQGKFADAKISGSPSETEYQSLQAALKPIMDDRKPLDKEYDSANNAYIKAMQEKKLDDKALDSMKYRTAAIHDKFEPYSVRFQTVYRDFFTAHPQSWVTANEFLFQVNSLGLDTAELLYGRLGPAIQQSTVGKKLAQTIVKLKAGSPGSMAADFSRKDLHGTDVSLSAYRGKYVLLDFWASWCVPCRKSMPHVKELYEKYKDKGLQVIAVSDDDARPDAWQKAVAKDGTDLWPNVLRGYDQKIPFGTDQPGDLDEKFGIQSLPTKILIDPSGKIVGRYDKATEEESASLDSKLANEFSAAAATK